MNQVGSINKKDIFNFGKLFALLGIVLVSVATLIPNRANATIIEVPYSWVYEFRGSCVLGCDTHDINGNPIASQGAGFELLLFNSIFGIPESYAGFDLTNGNFTFLESGRDNNFVVGDNLSSARLIGGRISPSDTVGSGPGFFGEVGNPGLLVDNFGNPTAGTYGSSSGPAAGVANVDYNFSQVDGFATTFNVIYKEIFEVRNQVPIADQNTSFYTADNFPFWQGIGTWNVIIDDTVAVQFNEPVSVPEPTTMGLMGLGVMGLVATRRKKLKQA